MKKNSNEFGVHTKSSYEFFSYNPAPRVRGWPIGIVLAFAAVTVGVSNQALAHRSPLTCTTNGSAAAISKVTALPTTVHGDELCYKVEISNTCTGCCDVSLLDSELVLPDGSIVTITVDADVFFGDSFTCPSVDPRCVTPSNCTILGEVGYRYIVSHVHEHGDTGGSCPPTPAAGSGEVSGYFRSTAGIVHLMTHVGAGLCKAIATGIAHACCEPCSGTCTNVYSEFDCPFPSVFTPDESCDEATCEPLDCSPFDVKCNDSSCNPATGMCESVPVPNCCVTDANCPADTKCMDSFCDHRVPGNLFDNVCAVTPIAGCCVTDANCPADTKCVDHFCDHRTADPLDNVCAFTTIAGCCDADNDCPADTKCMDSFCDHRVPGNLFDNVCAITPVAGCCVTDSDCPPDPAKCVDSFCDHRTPGNLLDNVCATRPVTGCCVTNFDCPPDPAACMESFCDHRTAGNLVDNVCSTRPVADCCDSDSDCNDFDDCTDDSCDLLTNTCVNVLTCVEVPTLSEWSRVALLSLVLMGLMKSFGFRRAKAD